MLDSILLLCVAAFLAFIGGVQVADGISAFNNRRCHAMAPPPWFLIDIATFVIGVACIFLGSWIAVQALACWHVG